MGLGNLLKKLKREAKANPGKAAFLGVAALVALYFWAPLVLGWMGKDKKPSTTASATKSVAKDAAAKSFMKATEAATKDKKAAERPSWHKIAEWRENNPRTKSASSLSSPRDPFQTPKVQVQESPEKEKVESASEKALAVSPSDAGLVLTSTIIGTGRHVAQLNGKTYVEGQTIEVAKGTSRIASFVLAEVHDRYVVLEADGQRYELTIPQPKQSDDIEITGSSKTNH